MLLNLFRSIGLGFVVEIIEIIEIAGVMMIEGEKGSQSVCQSVPFVSLLFIINRFKLLILLQISRHKNVV